MTGIDHDHGQAGGQRHFQTARHFHHDTVWVQCTQKVAEGLDRLLVVGHALAGLVSPDGHVKLVFGDVNPHIGVCHGGMLQYATVPSFAVPAWLNRTSGPGNLYDESVAGCQATDTVWVLAKAGRGGSSVLVSGADRAAITFSRCPWGLSWGTTGRPPRRHQMWVGGRQGLKPVSARK